MTDPHRSSITVDWTPSTTISNPEAVHAFLDGCADRIRRYLADWDLDPHVTLDHKDPT